MRLLHDPASLRPTHVHLSFIALIAAVGCARRSPRAVFDDEIAPILEARCASSQCHGVRTGSADGDVVDWTRLFFSVDADGHLTDLDAAAASCRTLINTLEPAILSSLVRKPLPASHGGLPHGGGDNFSSPRDPAVEQILAWIDSEDQGGEDTPPLTGNEALFESTVQPALVSASCMNGNCHGVQSAVPFRLDSSGVDGHIARSATRHNYEASLTMLSLDGFGMQSRLLTKGLPLFDGGIVHRGGNTGFFTGRQDPRVAAIANWACAERQARLQLPCTPEQPIRGIVYVRGELAPEAPFDLDVFSPGTDIYYARVDATLTAVDQTNLTASLHSQPADVRDPAVDHTGRKLAFAMRESADSGHDLYEIDLETAGVRRLTDDAGPMATGGRRTHREPTYAPDGHIWFVSTRAGILADGGQLLDADLYELDPSTGAITQRTFTPHIERRPVFLVSGEEAGGEIAFTALRDAIAGQRRAHPFRFPPDLSTEYHQHFGITPPENLFTDLRELPDGRYTIVIGDLGNAWGLGRLGIIDRNFGPEIPSTATSSAPAMPAYESPLVRLDEQTSNRGLTMGAYRDPVALPDGRLLVAYATSAIDLGDLNAQPELRIELLTLSESPARRGPSISARNILIAEPGVDVWDPEPVYARQPARMGEPAWDPSEATGSFVHNGLSIIEALLGNLPPSGQKVPRDDFAFVRLVEAVSTTPSALDGPWSLGSVSPSRVLAELPLAADGTFQIDVPAGVPFRLQGLDANFAAIGAVHNRWYYVAPGQKLVQGTTLDAYENRCAICHGARDGRAANVLVEPDILTGASITLSRYTNKNPRLPIVAPVASDATRIAVDFVHEVAPIIERCAASSCHAGPTPAGGLALTREPRDRFDVAYVNLLTGGHVNVEAGAANSSLFDALANHDGLQLSDDDRRTLVRWVDLGAGYRLPGRSAR